MTDPHKPSRLVELNDRFWVWFETPIVQWPIRVAAIILVAWVIYMVATTPEARHD